MTLHVELSAFRE